MPLMNRPRVVIDGVRRTRTYRFFWCSHCDRTVRIASASPNPLHNFLCPLCYNLVCQEIDISRTSNLSSYRTGSSATSASAAQLLDTMAQIINLSSPRRLTLRPQFTTHMSSSQPLPRPVSPQENALSWVAEQEPPGQTPQNQTTENNNSSCITEVRATADALCSDSACPICKEDFIMNQEIRKLACNHFYHSDCIMSWLQINNTCPVCRYQLPLQRGSTNNNSVRNNFRAADYGHNVDDSDDDYDLHLEDVVSLSWPSWAELISLLRPFCLSSLLDWS
ncbi:E3 ubiquitin-protein ligase RING1-like [Chenopodium quinoa]|nr:E3 ubiquitin-protein ligase RING1-like [Chenopodium quinoa]XP_021771126.1 E3 ubiquitin-protein ligase RING1-like [Chenopodium quinoa]